jgi:hypothetical protein
MPTPKLPLKNELLAAMKVAENDIEAANYLVQRFKEILTEAKMLDKSKDVLEKVEDYAKYVQFKLLSKSQPWSGEAGDKSNFANMQSNIADDAATKLKGAIENGDVNGNIKLDIALNDMAQLLRGYSADGKALDSKTVDLLDKLFNSWLAENEVVSKGSTLHECDENGQVKEQDPAEKQKMVEKIKELITNNQEGFAKYLKDKGIPITIQQHKYPEARSEAEKEQDVKAAIEAGTDNKEGMADEEGVHAGPSEPSL